MEMNDDQDHAAFWADDQDMKCKTGEYRKKVQEALASKLLPPPGPPSSVSRPRHPWMGHAPDPHWKLEIFELEAAQSNVPGGPLLQYTSVRELQSYWKRTPRDGSAGKTRRHVIILEELDARLAELLGVELDIPPEFFLAHCYMFADLSVRDGSYADQGSSTYWKVPIPRRRSYNLPWHWSDDMVLTSGSFDRIPTIAGSTVNYYGYVSYWGKTYEDGSWTSLLLVDPDGRHIYAGPEGTRIRVDLDSWTPQINDIKSDPCHEVLLGSLDKKDQPYARSLYDALVEAHRYSQPAHTSDPFSGTAFARNLTQAVWEEHIIRDEWEALNVLAADQWQHTNFQGTPESNLPEFQQLIATRQSIKLQRRYLHSIVWKFRCDDISHVSLARENQEFRDKTEECRRWRILEEKCQATEAYIADQLEMYSQRAAMEEAFSAKQQAQEANNQTREANKQTREANRMARSSGQLTKIATIIVPCSFVASIFSMGGDFAAGEKHFYLYWVISVPITILLLSWVLYADVRSPSDDRDSVDEKRQFPPPTAPAPPSSPLFLVRARRSQSDGGSAV